MAAGSGQPVRADGCLPRRPSPHLPPCGTDGPLLAVRVCLPPLGEDLAHPGVHPLANLASLLSLGLARRWSLVALQVQVAEEHPRLLADDFQHLIDVAHLEVEPPPEELTQVALAPAQLLLHRPLGPARGTDGSLKVLGHAVYGFGMTGHCAVYITGRDMPATNGGIRQKHLDFGSGILYLAFIDWWSLTINPSEPP